MGRVRPSSGAFTDGRSSFKSGKIAEPSGRRLDHHLTVISASEACACPGTTVKVQNSTGLGPEMPMFIGFVEARVGLPPSAPR
jgi:hypothetical protein